MKTIQRLLFLIISLKFVLPIFSQNPEWISYTNGDEVYSLAEEGNDIWVGTTGGLVQLDKSSGTPTGAPLNDFDDNPRPDPPGSNPDMPISALFLGTGLDTR